MQANAKLDKAGAAADDSERAKKVFENKAGDDDKRIAQLEKELKEAREKAEAADTAYEEVAKKLAACESDEEKANQREKSYKEQIKALTAKLKQAEARAEFADKS